MKKIVLLAFTILLLNTSSFAKNKNLAEIEASLEQMECAAPKKAHRYLNVARDIAKLQTLNLDDASLDVLMAKNTFYQDWSNAEYDEGRLKSIELAHQQADSALAKDKNLFSAYILKVKFEIAKNILLKSNDYSAAENYLKIAKKKTSSPNDKSSYLYHKGMIDYYNNDFKSAEKIFKKLLKIPNLTDNHHTSASNILMSLGGKKDLDKDKYYEDYYPYFINNVEEGFRNHSSDELDNIFTSQKDKLLRQKGKPIFLYFTSNDKSCPYCVKQNPIYEEIKEKYKEKIDFVRIDFDPNWTSISNSSCSEKNIRSLFNLTGVPRGTFYSISKMNTEEMKDALYAFQKKKGRDLPTEENLNKTLNKLHKMDYKGYKQSYAKNIPSWFDTCFELEICGK